MGVACGVGARAGCFTLLRMKERGKRSKEGRIPVLPQKKKNKKNSTEASSIGSSSKLKLWPAMCPARLCPFYRFVGAPREARDPRHAVGVETVTLQSRDGLAGCILGPVRNFVSTELACFHAPSRWNK